MREGVNILFALQSELLYITELVTCLFYSELHSLQFSVPVNVVYTVHEFLPIVKNTAKSGPSLHDCAKHVIVKL